MQGCTCSAEIRIWTASAMAAMASLNRIWRCNIISYANKFKLYKSLVTSILPSGRETWTLLAVSERKRMQAFETKCLRKLHRITYTWRTRPTTGCGARSTSLWILRNLLWQLSRDGSLHGSGMSLATTTSRKPSFRVPWRESDAVIG